MKLQEICDKIKLRYDIYGVLGEDFIVKRMIDQASNLFVDDDLLGGLELSPFEDMILWPDMFPLIETSFEPMIVESLNSIVLANPGWPATFADIGLKT